MSIMDPEFFGTILKPKVVGDREIVVVAHDSLRLESVIDGTDNSGLTGATWHMDQADPNLHVALLNLEAIMREMGWNIEARGWTCVEGDEHIYFADFERTGVCFDCDLPMVGYDHSSCPINMGDES